MIGQGSRFIIAISGSRGITDQARVWEVLDQEYVYYVCLGVAPEFRLGDAAGVDHLALKWARERGVPRTIYFADRRAYEVWQQSVGLIGGEGGERGLLASDWDSDGKSAGPIRNSAMVGLGEHKPLADLCVAIWDGSSRGTRNCMATARNAGVFIHQYGGGQAITFKTPELVDGALVEYRGELE